MSHNGMTSVKVTNKLIFFQHNGVEGIKKIKKIIEYVYISVLQI